MNPLVIAHRGAPLERHENTVASIDAASRYTVDFVEIDVHLSSDGAVVVHHDDDLVRSAGVAGRVEDLTLAELRALRLTFGTQHGEPLATLEDAAAAARGVPLAVELKLQRKAGTVALTEAVLARRALLHPACVLISFERDAVERAALSIGPARVGLIRNRDYGDDGWKDLLAAHAEIAVVSKKIVTEPMVRALQAAGKRVWLYALDTDEELTRGLALRAEGLISNDPARARASCDKA